MDPDEQIDHLDYQLDYYHAEEDMKCKLFSLSLNQINPSML